MHANLRSFQWNMFLTVFHSFPPFLCPRANCSRCSFLKNGGSDLLTSLFTKERPWANCYYRLLQKSYVSDLLLLLFNRLFIVSESPYHSFAHKNKRFTWKTKSKFPTLFPGKGETKYKMFVNIDQYSKQMHFYEYPRSGHRLKFRK